MGSGSGSSPQRPSLLSSDSGFTLLELMVSSLISLTMVAMTIGLTLSARELFFYDQSRIELQQNLRSAVDLMGIDIREGGERFNGSFPAVLVTDGGTNSDQIRLRRNLLDEVLVVCADITSGTALTELALTNLASTVAACTYGSQASNVDAWETYRAAHGNIVKVFIFDQASKLGEWIEYESLNDTGTEQYLGIAGHTFTHSYAGGATAVYVMEERLYRLQNDLLELVENDDFSAPLNVAFGLTGLQLQVFLQDGTTLSAMAETEDWTEIESIEISLGGQIQVTGKAGTVAGEIITRSVTSRFFPRNVLSN